MRSLLAVPAHAAAALVPGLQTPKEYRAIVNAHFRMDVPADVPPMIGVINGTVEWIFAFPGRLSVTISNADRLMDMPRAELAQTIWQEVCQGDGNCRRAAAVADRARAARDLRRHAGRERQASRRAGRRWGNLFLAGDWTATGLPATLESAVRSGNRAAELVMRQSRGAA